MTAIPSRAVFGSAVGSRVRAGAVPGLGGPADLLVTAVEDRRTPAGWECFSVLFEGPAEAPLAQGTFPLSGPALGETELFLVPVGEGRGKRTYEAVVYRPLPRTPSGD